jgi:hypothetical protein
MPLPPAQRGTVRPPAKETAQTAPGIVERIDVCGSLNGYDFTGAFVKELNHEVTYFNEHNHCRIPKDLSRVIVTVARIPNRPWSGTPGTPLPEITGEKECKLIFSRDYDLAYRHPPHPRQRRLERQTNRQLQHSKRRIERHIFSSQINFNYQGKP